MFLIFRRFEIIVRLEFVVHSSFVLLNFSQFVYEEKRKQKQLSEFSEWIRLKNYSSVRPPVSFETVLFFFGHQALQVFFFKSLVSFLLNKNFPT